MRNWKWLTLLIASSMLLGGCAMGGASGTKTTQGIAALDDGNYTQAQQDAREKMWRSNFYVSSTTAYPQQELFEKLCTKYRIPD